MGAITNGVRAGTHRAHGMTTWTWVAREPTDVAIDDHVVVCRLCQRELFTWSRWGRDPQILVDGGSQCRGSGRGHAVRRPLERGEVELLHREHRLHGALRPRRVGVVE